MNNPIRILGIAGSFRQASYNRRTLRAAAELVPKGAVVEIFELDGITIYNQDKEGDLLAPVGDFKRRIHEADAVLFVTPECNFSIPGALKNAIDSDSRPYVDNSFEGNPAAIMGASVGTIAAARAQYDLRKMMALF